MDVKEAYRKMIETLDNGDGVLTAGVIHEDIPTIQMVGHREGQRLRTATEVQHHGYGMFSAKTASGRLSFDGGGAMYRARDDDDKYAFSWTALRASAEVLAEIGYDREAVRAALVELLETEATS